MEEPEIINPFEEVVPPHRRIELDRVSKHRAGRQPKMTKEQKRKRDLAARRKMRADVNEFYYRQVLGDFD